MLVKMMYFLMKWRMKNPSDESRERVFERSESSNRRHNEETNTENLEVDGGLLDYDPQSSCNSLNWL